MSSTEPIVFRPPLMLRIATSIFGLISLPIAVGLLWLMVSRLDGSKAPLVGVMLIPVALAGGTLRRSVAISAEKMVSTTLFRKRTIGWTQVRRLDQTRRSFVAVTELGEVSAGWLRREDRDRFMRLILQYAKLMPGSEAPRFGIQVQYVPRVHRIELQGLPTRKRTRDEK